MTLSLKSTKDPKQAINADIGSLIKEAATSNYETKTPKVQKLQKRLVIGCSPDLASSSKTGRDAISCALVGIWTKSGHCGTSCTHPLIYNRLILETRSKETLKDLQKVQQKSGKVTKGETRLDRMPTDELISREN